MFPRFVCDSVSEVHGYEVEEVIAEETRLQRSVSCFFLKLVYVWRRWYIFLVLSWLCQMVEKVTIVRITRTFVSPWPCQRLAIFLFLPVANWSEV